MIRQYETATHPALAHRETREANPFDRIVFCPTAERFQVLQMVTGRDGREHLIRKGSYESLADALAARDAEHEGEGE